MELFKLKYGDSLLEFSVPKENIIGVLDKKQGNKIPESEIINYALDNPISSDNLEDIVEPGEKICIVISDITRAWQRMSVFLPLIVDRLIKTGIKDEDITLLCATGSHRKQTLEEHRVLLGEKLYSRFQVIDHDSRDSENMIYIGTTSFGTPVKINKIALESDHIIITGAVVFHDLVGWGGGKKSILPGIAAYETIMKNHSLSLNSGLGSGIHPSVRSGNIINNPLHEDMEEAVKMVNPSFMFNVLIGDDGLICDAVAGHYLKAHEVGREKVSQLNALKIKERADLVVVSCGGYPKDIDFYQATKALINAKESIKKGGTIILLSECQDGIGHEDMEKIILKYDNNIDREKEVRRSYTVSKFIGYLTGVIANDYNVVMVSSLDKDMLRRINIQGVDTIDEALNIVYKEKGKNLTTYVIPQGGDVLPIVNK